MPPDAGLAGPLPATPEDIGAINRLFSESFTDRYHRDGMTGVRVPHLNPQIWRFAIADAADGAWLWRDGAGAVAAFNMVHRSGSEGWMGPLAVRPDLQGGGAGSRVVQSGIEWLRAGGARTIGLETMPRTVENIGFYSRLGFRPGHLTVSLTREVRPGRAAGTERLSRHPGGAVAGVAECAALTESLRPGLDFSRELSLTLALGLGDATLVREGGGLAGFALWHSAPLAEGRGRDELRVLKVGARDLGTFEAVRRAVEQEARAERVGRVALRCQTAYGEAYGALLAAGYRVHWTDLRMTLAGYPEPDGRPGIVFSNWEI